MGEGRHSLIRRITIRSEAAKAKREKGELKIEEGNDILRNPYDNTPVFYEKNRRGEDVPVGIRFYRPIRILSIIINVVATVLLPLIIAATVRLIDISGTSQKFSDGFRPMYGAAWYVFARLIAIIYFAIIGNEKYTGDVLYQKTYTDSSFNRHTNYGELDQYLVQNHHVAIVSHEKFDRTNAVLRQRGKEKGNGRNTEKYQNRYSFSGRIRCAECGGSFKRRIHYKPSGSYIAWCCATNLTDKGICSMKYITDDALKRAFVTMMNKLVFGHQIVLRPLLQSLRGMNDRFQLLKMQDLELQIEKNMEQRQVLTSLMAGGYLEPVLFNKENNALAVEAEALRQEKDSLMHSLNGNMVKANELQKLFRFVSKGIMMDGFDDEAFLTYVDSITIHSRSEVAFELKCGVSLKERLVD